MWKEERRREARSGIRRNRWGTIVSGGEVRSGQVGCMRVRMRPSVQGSVPRVMLLLRVMVLVVVVAAAAPISRVGASSAASRVDSSRRSLARHLVRANTAINNQSPALKVTLSRP